MTIRDIIKKIKRVAIFELGGGITFRRGDILYEDLDQIINLSARLEPKRPVIRFDYIGDWAPNKCPNCDCGVIGFPFCPKCGQALLWGEEVNKDETLAQRSDSSIT